MQDEDSGGSAPCFAHQLVGGHPVDPDTWRDVRRFRRAERERLYALRRQMSVAARARQSAAVSAALDELLPDPAGLVVAGYWPIRGELDLRDWMARAHARGARLALPVVVEKGRPVEFRAWAPGAAMQRGIWNIPVPAESRALAPQVVIVPLVGLDRELYRLGNGGGYYDMTLAACSPRPRLIGVGQDFCRIATIFPQPWDIAMDCAALGDGTVLGARAS
ncbi:MAG: 5-formyltetrahydrofolate cyclo-ligase [Roseovarius sp.]